MAMYKITCICSKGTEYENNPINDGKGLFFVKYAFTNNAELADYYRERIGTISVNEVDETEYESLREYYIHNSKQGLLD